MSRMRGRLASAGLAALAFLAAFGAGQAISAFANSSVSEGRAVQRSSGQLVGAFLPRTTLQSAEGVVRLRDHVDRPALVIVADREVCLSCANFPLELRVLANSHPGLQGVLVLSGPDTAFFRSYARKNGLSPGQYLLDPAGDLPRALGMEAGPLVMLADSAGRILWADARTGPQFGPTPVSRVLPQLHDLLSSARGLPADTAPVADPAVRGGSGRTNPPAQTFTPEGGAQ